MDNIVEVELMVDLVLNQAPDFLVIVMGVVVAVEVDPPLMMLLEDGVNKGC
jgi:hypothetical protein